MRDRHSIYGVGCGDVGGHVFEDLSGAGVADVLDAGNPAAAVVVANDAGKGHDRAGGDVLDALRMSQLIQDGLADLGAHDAARWLVDA
jgi:hypothetical protein